MRGVSVVVLTLALALVLPTLANTHMDDDIEYTEEGMPKPRIYEVEPQQQQEEPAPSPPRPRQTPLGRDETRQRARQHTSTADQNQDGIVSYAEHQDYFQKHFVEQEASGRWSAHIRDYYRHLDSDRDGQLTVKEYEQLYSKNEEM